MTSISPVFYDVQIRILFIYSLQNEMYKNTQNKYLKNNLLPKSVKNEKYNNLNFGWIFRAEWEVWFNSRPNAPKQP